MVQNHESKISINEDQFGYAYVRESELYDLVDTYSLWYTHRARNSTPSKIDVP